MQYEIITNEWLRANGNKLLRREVLCVFSDEWKEVCIFNGIYWTTQDGHRIVETISHYIVAFYVFERCNLNELL